jgi:hypothetical protein
MSELGRSGLAAGATLAAGAVNAIAGGGSLITFPALVASGLPAVVANVTNAVALTPGFVGAPLAQRRDLVGQGRRPDPKGEVADRVWPHLSPRNGAWRSRIGDRTRSCTRRGARRRSRARSEAAT